MGDSPTCVPGNSEMALQLVPSPFQPYSLQEVLTAQDLPSDPEVCQEPPPSTQLATGTLPEDPTVNS